MTAIPTASRIFADRYCREIKRLEALHAGKISPGTRTWRDAIAALFTRMRQSGSPTRQAAVLGRAITYLNEIETDDYAHLLIGQSSAKRSAFVCFATFCADQHPLVGVDEEGIKVLEHFIRCNRDGSASAIYDIDLAYVSKHAIIRLHEREHDLTRGGATGVLAVIGMLGYLTRNNAKHIMGELCLHFGDTLVVGSLKHSSKRLSDGRQINGSFFDVRTALPADEVKSQEMLEQGRIASDVVARWFANPLNDDDTLANRIPLLPRRADDYTLRSAAVTH